MWSKIFSYAFSYLINSGAKIQKKPSGYSPNDLKSVSYCVQSVAFTLKLLYAILKRLQGDGLSQLLPIARNGNNLSLVAHVNQNQESLGVVALLEHKYIVVRICGQLTLAQGGMLVVKTISEKAFYYCSSLNSITIPASITLVQNEAFADYNQGGQ